MSGRRKGFFYRAVLAAGLAAVLTGCGEKPQPPVEITLIHGWGSTEADHVAMRRIYSDFEKENPDIQLKLISLPTSEEVVRRAEDMLMVGEVPDVLFLGGSGRNSVYRFMVENGLALDLMPYVEQDSEFAGNLSTANTEYWTTETGQMYTVSDVLLLCGGYWYNEDIFREAGIGQTPKTWEEFFAACEKIEDWKEKNGEDVTPLWVLPEGYLYFADHMMIGKDQMMQSEVSCGNMPEPDREIPMILDQLKAVYQFSGVEAEEYSYRDETHLFNEGRVAMYINGVWGAPMISEKVNASYALLPTYDGRSASCQSSCVGYVAGKSGDTKRMEASVRFLKYIMSTPVQERILKETGQMPANPHVDVRAIAGEQTKFWQAVNLVQTAELQIEVPENLWENNKMDLFEENILDVLSGKLNPQTFTDIIG